MKTFGSLDVVSANEIVVLAIIVAGSVAAPKVTFVVLTWRTSLLLLLLLLLLFALGFEFHLNKLR